MKKISVILLSFCGVLAVRGAQEPVLDGWITKKIPLVEKGSDALAKNIAALYKEQRDFFIVSQNQAVEPVEDLSSYLQHAKDLVDDTVMIAANSNNAKLQEYADKLRSLTIKLFNTAETINGNITTALADSELGKQSRELIEETLDRLAKILGEFDTIAVNCDQYAQKNKYYPFAHALGTYAKNMVKIAKAIRDSAKQIVTNRRPAPGAQQSAPKKKKWYKRLVGG